VANKANAKARIGLYEKTAQSYSNMTPAIADSLAGKYFTNRFDQEKTLELYYKRIKAATNAIIAFEFYQAEVYMLTQLRASIMQQIPTYGQLQGCKIDLVAQPKMQDLTMSQNGIVLSWHLPASS
jgi:hypothetical protein